MGKVKAFLTTLLMEIFILTFTVTAYGAGWSNENGYWRYQNLDGSYISSSSKFIDGKLCHFDVNGCLLADPFATDNIYLEYLYKNFLSQNFWNKNVQIALADLTNDGREEMILVWNEYSASRITHIYVYTIIQNQVREIVNETSYNFRHTFYLCIRNGKACLLEKEHGIYQGEGGLSYKLYDFKPDCTENILDSYSTYILRTAQGDKDTALFEAKIRGLTKDAVLVAEDESTELWPANNVLRNNEAVYEGACGPLVKENGVYHYSGIIEGYDEARAEYMGHWTEGAFELLRGNFYVDDSTKVIIQSEIDFGSNYGFPAYGKSATAWLDDFYARKEYWMVLRIKVKENHIEEILGIYSFD